MVAGPMAGTTGDEDDLRRLRAFWGREDLVSRSQRDDSSE
jgi:hypothetical protein